MAFVLVLPGLAMGPLAVSGHRRLMHDCCNAYFSHAKSVMLQRTILCFDDRCGRSIDRCRHLRHVTNPNMTDIKPVTFAGRLCRIVKLARKKGRSDHERPKSREETPKEGYDREQSSSCRIAKLLVRRNKDNCVFCMADPPKSEIALAVCL
ncbi:hypothetical protein [Hyphomicrobium sulfonivorans]|uniref:hypothetical protein n=1 Tax=Hyphomicrobium sulfonivorans TaxID=121290 RepID=UPI0012EDBADB|nr:hypothetical protein [Hyphomicrobium sulfonivorans]